MQTLPRLILPLGLAVMAAGMNAAIMSTRLSHQEFVIVTRDIEPGEQINPEDLDVVEVGYPNSGMEELFFTWKEGNTLIESPPGIRAPMPLTTGDLVPRLGFRDYAALPYTVPTGHFTLMLRVRASAVEDSRKELIPGCPIIVKLVKSEVSSVDATLSFLEPVRNDGKTNRIDYVIGILLRMDDEGSLIARHLTTGNIRSLVRDPGDS